MLHQVGVREEPTTEEFDRHSLYYYYYLSVLYSDVHCMPDLQPGADLEMKKWGLNETLFNHPLSPKCQ